MSPEALERVVEQGLADGDGGFAAAHAIVEHNDLLLHIGQTPMRADFQHDLRVPVCILTGIDIAGTDAKDTGKQEVLEMLVGVAPSPCAPAEARLEGIGIRLQAPAWYG